MRGPGGLRGAVDRFFDPPMAGAGRSVRRPVRTLWPRTALARPRWREDGTWHRNRRYCDEFRPSAIKAAISSMVNPRRKPLAWEG